MWFSGILKIHYAKRLYQRRIRVSYCRIKQPRKIKQTSQYFTCIVDGTGMESPDRNLSVMFLSREIMYPFYLKKNKFNNVF